MMKNLNRRLLQRNIRKIKNDMVEQLKLSFDDLRLGRVSRF